MPARLSQGAIKSTQGYVCIPCRLRHVARKSVYIQRFQYASASQVTNSTSETPVVSQSSSPHESLQRIAVDSGAQLSESAFQNEGSVSAQATKLQQTLQRQFAERRRVNILANKGASPPLQSMVEDIKAPLNNKNPADLKSGKSIRARRSESRKPIIVSPKDSSSVKEQKATASIKARRLRSRPQSTSRTDGRPTAAVAKAAVPTLSELLDDNKGARSAKPKASENDPFAKLHADVQRLKQVLESEDKANRVTKTQLSKLQTPKETSNATSTQSNTTKDPPEPVVSEDIADDAEIVSSKSDTAPVKAVSLKAIRRTKSDVALVRAVSSPQKEVKKLPKGMSTLKDSLIHQVASAKGIDKPSKKADSKPVKPARRKSPRKDAVIEVVNAEELKISGKLLFCEYGMTSDDFSGRG